MRACVCACVFACIHSVFLAVFWVGRVEIWLCILFARLRVPMFDSDAAADAAAAAAFIDLVICLIVSFCYCCRFH